MKFYAAKYLKTKLLVGNNNVIPNRVLRSIGFGVCYPKANVLGQSYRFGIPYPKLELGYVIPKFGVRYPNGVSSSNSDRWGAASSDLCVHNGGKNYRSTTYINQSVCSK